MRQKRREVRITNTLELFCSLVCLVYLSRLAVQVDHVDFVPVSHPQAAAFGEAAANGLHHVRAERHHKV